MLTDEYGEVINGQDTYETIADRLKEYEHILIGWTDGLGTHFDILICNGSEFEGGNHQGGIRSNDLFVAIMRLGEFGFNRSPDLHPGYVGEKLNVGGDATAEKLAELINGIIAELNGSQPTA